MSLKNPKPKKRTILFAAGGTGGHVIPAYVLAKAIEKKHSDIQCIFVGAKGKFEQQWLPSQGFELELLNMGGITSGSMIKRLKGLLKLPGACWKSWKILKQYTPERLFGVGGYTSGPIMFLASLMGIPCAIIEPNAVAGRSNRIISKQCKRVYTVFEQANVFFPTDKVKTLGHLIRPEILNIPAPNFSQSKKTIAVLGGSQGAQSLNRIFCKMVQEAPEYFKENFKILHQAGEKNKDHVQHQYKNLDLDIDVFGFKDDMQSLYANTHIIIARAGSSVIEFASIGIPSILIPLSIAADDHQKANALALVKTGGASMIEEKDLNQALLFEVLQQTMAGDMQGMSKALRVLRRDQAVETIMEDFLNL